MFDFNQLVNLLNYKYGESNIFGASANKFITTYPGEWNEINQNHKKIVKSSYDEQGLSFNISESEVEIIGSVKFITFTIKFFNKEGEKFMTQTYYSTYINGYDFVTHITYTNDEIGADILKIWRMSIFNELTPDDPL